MPKDFKGASEISEKLTQLAEVLNAAQDLQFPKNNAFFSNLTETSETLNEIRRQIDRYLGANGIKKKMMAGDIRHKLKGLKYSLTFQVRLIDSVYVNPPMGERECVGQMVFKGSQNNQIPREDVKNIENHIKQRLDEMN